MNLFDKQEKQLISDLKVGQRVDTYYRLMSVDKRVKKDGGSFLTLEWMDRTGKMPAKVWSNAEAVFKKLKPGDIFRVNGYVNEYKGSKELNVDTVRPVTPQDKDYDPADFQEKPAFDTGALFTKFIELIKSNLTNPHLLKLTDLFVESYGEKFKNHYGAQKIHHAYMGGLLQHTCSMAELAVMIARHYSLDKELLLMGVLFHDVGKTFEFTVDPAPEPTVEGGLIGHIVISNSIFLDLKNRIPDFPRDLSIKIQHLIVSHHGEKEYGSPEVPRIPEAFALHIVDLLDSKMKIVEETVLNSESKGLFTDYVHSLGRRLLIEPGKK